LLVGRQELLASWPQDLMQSIMTQARAQAFWELRHKTLIAEVIEALCNAGIASVVLKGTALAYGFYDQPSARARGDTDLLIAHEHLDEASNLLGRLGWSSLSATHCLFGDARYQELWRYSDRAGLDHDCDLHWQVGNSVALKNALRCKDIFEKAIPLEGFSPGAKAADPQSLFYSYMHE
jgi:hypothetical protein